MASNIVAQMQILISAQTKGLNAALSQSQSALNTFQGTISKTNTLLTSFGVGFGLYQVTSVLVDAVGILKDFDQQMAVVKAVTQATSSEFEALRENAIDLGKSTKFTATEVGELQENLAKLGFTTPEILAATKGITALAVATGEDLAKSADVVGSTIRSFGLAATDTGRVVDVMAESFNKSALGLENFTEAIKYVAPIAAQAGLSLEQTTALLGVLADNGIRGSQAGTSLRKIITDLGTETGDLSERLEKLAAKGLTGADAMDEVGRTAYASLLILARNTDKSDAFAESLNKVSGAAQRTADIVGDTLSGDLDKLSSAYDALIISQNTATDVLRELTQAGTNFINNLSEQDSALGTFLDRFGELITIIPRAADALFEFFSDTKSAEFVRFQEALAQSIKDESAPAIKDIVNQLTILRNELGRPIDLKDIKTISDEYGLTAVQGERLIKIVKEINGEVREIDGIAQTGSLATFFQNPVLYLEDANKKLVIQVGLIQGIEDKIAEFEQKKKAAFSASEINNFSEKIKELRAQLEALNNPISNPSTAFGKKQLENAAAGIKTEVDKDLNSSALGGGFLTEIPAPDTSAYMEALQQTTDATLAAGASQILSYDQIRLANELLIQKEKERAEVAMQVGSIIGDTVGDVISGQKSLLQGVKQVTGEIIKLFLKRAMAGVIAGAAETTAPPPVILALAAAGIAGISALFSSAVGSSGGGGSAGASAKTTNVDKFGPTSSGNEGPSQFEFVLHGNDLVALATSEANRKKRLG